MRHAILACSLLSLSALAQAEPLPLKQGDHISIIGNVLAERMQHDGWLETLVQHRFGRHELVFRNLGFSGDELSERRRSEAFGSPDHWLTHCRSNVVFAFFGFGESFAGEAGLEKFKRDLDGLSKHVLGQKYDGASPARLVLFSPIAFENLGSPNLPDGTEHNRRLKLYAAAMANTAKSAGVVFVDLFQPTLAEYQRSDEPLTLNGHYLNERGNRFVAGVIDRALFSGVPAKDPDAGRLERLRQAVLDKNFHWYHRYRTTDGYNVYGGRSHLKYTDDVSNREVMQREMEILDAMAANRDRRIWAIAQGRDIAVDDSNTPPFIPVKTNKPGPHRFLGGDEAIEKMTVAKGMKVNLVASDEMFPELVNPVQMAFDPRGRLFVAVWPSYPHYKPKDEMNDKLLILEDTDGDGRADRIKTFADGLNNPTGFEFWGGGVLVMMGPDLMFIQDTDGDDVADVRVRVLHGLDTADSHHTANSFVLGPDGALYFQEGVFHQSQVETPYGIQRCRDACVWRFNPRTYEAERYVAYNFANPHGHVFTRWGHDIVHDGTSSMPFHATLFSGHLDYPAKHPQPPVLYDRRTRPCPATEILSSRHFPDADQGNLLVGNVIGVQGILQYRIDEKQSSFAGTEVEPIVTSSDPNFRPSDMEIGADGALYFLDWQNPIIGHMQHHIRDPNRDKTHGRVYRVTYPGRPLLKAPKIAGAPIGELLKLLAEPEDRVRYRARIELSGRDTKEVLAGAERWMAGLDKNGPDYEHHVLEGLWLHQQHNVVNEKLLRRLLASSDHRVRTAATRVLCYWRDRIADSLGLLKHLARDEHPHVRLQAVRAASFYRVSDAIEVPLIAAELPSDPYLAYTSGETFKALDPYWKRALAEGKLPPASESGMRLLLAKLSIQELLKMKPDRAIALELLTRSGASEEHRREALKTLAALENTSELSALVNVINTLDQRQQGQGAIYDLARMLTGHSSPELSSIRPELEKMATGAKLPVVRQVGFVALIAADQGVDRAWDLTAGSLSRLEDLVSAAPLVVDPNQRAKLYPKILPLVDGSDQQAAIRRAAMNALTYIRGHESETFNKLAPFIREGIDRHQAIRAMQRIPRQFWPQEEARGLVDSILAYVRQVSTAQRTSPEVVDALQLGDMLASLLPVEEARSARAALGDLGVRVLRIGTLPHQMAYDKERLVAQAGKPVEIVFENTDLMPHNLVITNPGALEEVGLLAESTAQQPGALERHYVPPSKQILLSSQLVQPGQSQKLSYNVPRQPGVYPIVCTYPGHWRRMYGALYVVEDLDEYLANPEAYLAANPLPIADELLKFNRPRTEWKFDELSALVAELSHGRSFAGARQMFQVANCVACHRLNGDGQEFGPDLAKLDPKLTSSDILREILEPSHKINEKFFTYTFLLDSGQVVTGLIVEETPDVVKVVENPLAKSAPILLKTKEIEARQKSEVSIMPKGLLDKLTREEILNLVAYIISRGDEHHELFHGEHHH